MTAVHGSESSRFPPEVPDGVTLVLFAPPFARLRVVGGVTDDADAYDLLRIPLIRLRLRGCREVTLDLSSVTKLSRVATVVLARTMGDYVATDAVVSVVNAPDIVARRIAAALMEQTIRAGGPTNHHPTTMKGTESSWHQE